MATKMPWETSIFLRGRVQLLAGGWVSWYWVPKRDDAVERMNDVWVALTQEKLLEDRQGNRKGKCNFLHWFIWLK